MFGNFIFGSKESPKTSDNNSKKPANRPENPIMQPTMVIDGEIVVDPRRKQRKNA